MEDKKLTEEKLKKIEELVTRLEKVNEREAHPHPKHSHHPVPHHERNNLKIDFKDDKDLLVKIFGEEDTAKAVIDIITTSPTEIQIVLKVVIDLYNKLSETIGE